MQSLWKQPTIRLLEELEITASKHKDPVRRLKALLSQYAEFAIRESAVYRGAFLFVRPSSAERPAQVKPQEDRFFRLLREAISEGQQNNQIISGEPNHLAQTLWAGLHGAIALPTNIDRVAFDAPNKLTRRMIKLLLSAIAPNESI